MVSRALRTKIHLKSDNDVGMICWKIVICRKLLRILLNEVFSKLAERIRFHYQEQTVIERFMDVRRVDLQNFEPLQYLVKVDSQIFQESFDIDELSQKIGKDLANYEFSKFIFSLKKVPCKTVKTTLNRLVETLDQIHDELCDICINTEQLFMPWVLKKEIRRRKQSGQVGIAFSTQNLLPILAQDLGNSQIIFSNKHCFSKTYPTTLDKQILFSIKTRSGKPKVDCQIIQNLHFRNLENMRRIIVTDAESSDFLNPDIFP